MKNAVLVVGGGIGGLVLARALARLDVPVEILERSERLRAVGAGITLGANALRLLEELGLGPALHERGALLSMGDITDQRARLLSRADLSEIEAQYGRTIAIERGALHEILASGLEESGHVRVHTSETLKSLEFSGEGATDSAVHVETTTGRQLEPRAVVGADGLHSIVRRFTWGTIEPRYSGYTCWRWTGAVPGGATSMREMWGAGKRVGVVPLSNHRVYGFFVANAPAGTPSDPSHSSADFLRQKFAEFGGDVPRVLEAIRDGELLHHDIEEIVQTPWSRGSVTLLGDAAHAMTPNLGQGAAMAIEDAVVLARELSAHDDVTAALRAYEARRRPRVEEIQTSSRRIGVVAQWQSSPAIWLRNLALRSAPASSTRRTIEGIVSYVP